MKVLSILVLLLIATSNANGSPITAEVNMTTHQVMGTINVAGHGPVTIVTASPSRVRVKFTQSF